MSVAVVRPELSGVPAPADVILRFDGEDAFLSNFSDHPVRWQDICYPTAEAAFQAGKTLDPTQRAMIAAAPSPAKAKQLGRAVVLRPGWDVHVRHTVMREVLVAKFTDPDLAARLVGTGTALLVEGNSWCDQFWGCCTCPRHRAIPGQNWLGRHLMHLRSTLASAQQADRWVRVACTGHRPHRLPAGSHEWVEDELRRIAGNTRRRARHRGRDQRGRRGRGSALGRGRCRPGGRCGVAVSALPRS